MKEIYKIGDHVEFFGCGMIPGGGWDERSIHCGKVVSIDNIQHPWQESSLQGRKDIERLAQTIWVESGMNRFGFQSKDIWKKAKCNYDN